MKLDQQTQALIEGIKQSTNQQNKKDREIVEKAIESHAKKVGKQLIAQQGAQKQQQELQTEEIEPEDG